MTANQRLETLSLVIAHHLQAKFRVRAKNNGETITPGDVAKEIRKVVKHSGVQIVVAQKMMEAGRRMPPDLGA